MLTQSLRKFLGSWSWSSSSLSLSCSSSSAAADGCAVLCLYKMVAFLALLSLIPSSPPSSPSLSVTTAAASMMKEADLQKIFKLRNENDWKSLWHSEKHVRCRDQLLNHMDWACQKDIYRLEKRRNVKVPLALDHEHELAQSESEDNNNDNDPFGDEVFIGKSLADTVIKPWTGYVRRKREEKSITDECCSAAGCTWEEYAEYCPAHRRLQTRRFLRRK